MAVPNSLTDPLSGTSLLDNAPAPGATLSDGDLANIERAGPNGLVNFDAEVPEYQYSPGDKPSSWTDLVSTPELSGAGTDDRLRAFDNHSRRVSLWMENQPEYTPSMRAEVTRQIREKRAEIESERTIGEKAGKLGKGLVDSMVASVGGAAFAGASQFTEGSREAFYDMLGASTAKAIDYVTNQHIDREVPAAQSERYAELLGEGFTERTGGGKWIGKWIDRREKLDGAVESFKEDLDNGNFPGDPDAFKAWVSERQDIILDEARKFNGDDEDYRANPSRKFSTDLDLVNSLSNYTATRSDASFNLMIQQMVRSSDREKADNQWEKAFSEGRGVTGGIREAERAQTGSDEISRLVAEGGTDPTELASTAISAVLTGGTAKAISTVAGAGSRAGKIGSVAANTAMDVAVEAGTEAFQSQVEDPNSSPWEAAADGALLALAFQVTGAAVGAGGRITRRSIQGRESEASGSNSAENERQPGLPPTDDPRTSVRRDDGPVTSVLDEIAGESSNLEEAGSDLGVDEDIQPGVGEDVGGEEISRQRGEISPEANSDEISAQEPTLEELRSGDEEVDTPDAPLSQRPSINLPPRASGPVSPRPGRKGRDQSERDEWDEKYGDARKGGRSHNDDGSPYQPTVIEEVVQQITEDTKGYSFDQFIDSIGTDGGAEMGTGVRQLLDAGWIWDRDLKRMVNPADPGQSPSAGLRALRSKPVAPEAPHPTGSGTSSNPASPAPSESSSDTTGSDASPEPSVVRSFDLGEDLRADLVQNPDGTVSVRKSNAETGAEIPLRGAEQPFPDIPSATRFVAETFSIQEDAAVSSQSDSESVVPTEESGETDPLMILLAREKMQPVQADISQIGRVSRREQSGFRAMDRDSASRGDYHGAPLIRDYQGNKSAQGRLRAIYDRNSSNRPDQVAQMAYDELGPNVISEPTAEALFDAIKRRLDGDAGRVSQDRTSDAEISAMEQARGLEAEASFEGFMQAISSPWRKGGEARAGDLQVGDRLTAGDAVMEVTEADPDGITVRSSVHGTHSLPTEERIGYDSIEENGIPASEREGTSPENVVSRDETAALTDGVREALAVRGIEWSGRALTSREHSSMVRSRAHLEAARRIAQLFGRRVVGVTGDFPANGAVVPGDTDNIYLRVDSSRSELLVASHEMLHQMRQSDPELYSELLATLDADLTAYIDQVRPEHGDGSLDMDGVKEEFLADYLAERSGDVRFWDALAARDPSLFERFASYVTAFLREIRELIAADGIKVEQFIRNQAEMRDAIESVMVAFRARQGLGQRGLLDGFDETMPFSDRVGIPDPPPSPSGQRTSIDPGVGWVMFSDRVLTEPGNVGIKAWHGTPHDVDRFSTDQIGTGEGAQVYGWGLYFAEDRKVAEWYRESLSSGGPPMLDGSPVQPGPSGNFTPEQTAAILIRNLGFREARDSMAGHADNESLPENRRAEAREVLARIEGMDPARLGAGNLYGVRLKVEEGELIDWDKPLSDQGKSVKGNVRRIIEELNDSFLNARLRESGNTGAGLYVGISDAVEKNPSRFREKYGDDVRNSPDKVASRILSDYGINGIRYLDGSSRSSGEGTYNYVVFDGADIEITSRNGESISPSRAISDSIRFSDFQPKPRLYQPTPPVTKPNQQVAGEAVGRPDEVQTDEERIATVRNHYFDGTRGISPQSISEAYEVIADMEAGTFDASFETGLDGANSTLVGEIYSFAARVLAETGDDAMLQRVKNRANDYFNRERTVAGRSLNAARQYATPLDNALSEINKGKRAAVDGASMADGGQIVALSEEVERLNRELDAMRVQLSDFTARETASIVSEVEGKRSSGRGSDRAAKILTGGKKGGRRIAALAEELEAFLSSGAGDAMFSDREISADERNFAIRRILEEQVRSGKRKRAVFVRNLVRLGMAEEQAGNRYDKAMEFRERAKAALAEDRKEAKAVEPEKTSGELLVEALDAESKRLDRLNRMVDRISDRLLGGKRTRRKPEESKRSDLEQFVSDQTMLGDGFDREAAIKGALRLGVESGSAARLADAIEAGIRNDAAKREGRKGPRRKDVSERARDIAERFDNPQDKPERRERDPLRKLVGDTVKRDSSIGESTFVDRAKGLGVSRDDASNLWRSLSEERARRQEIRDLKRRADEESRPGEQARRIVRRLAESQSDTQDNRPRSIRENEVNSIYRDYVSHGGYGSRPGPAMSRPGFVSALMQEGVPRADAESLATMADRERRNQEDANKGRGAANAVERSVPFIMREILAHPELRLVGPSERLRMMASVFEDRAGMGPVDARAAAQRMESILVRKWDEAAKRLAEEWATKRNAPGFRKEPGASGAKSQRKTVFDTVLEAIRAGAYDPRKRVLDEVAKANGWHDLTESELRKLAELDARLSAGVSSEGMTWFEDMRIRREIARTINQSSLPAPVKKLIREYYLANIFSGIRTWMLQHSVFFNVLANVGVRDFLSAAYGSATGSDRVNMVGYANAWLGMARHVKNGLADAGLGFLKGEVRGVAEQEVLQSTSQLEGVFDRAMSVLSNPRSTVAQRTWAGTKIFLSSVRFSFRVLAAFDGLYQGVIRTYTNELELFSKAAGMGLGHQELRAMTGEVLNLTEQFRDEAEAKGFTSIVDREAYVNDRVTMALYDGFEGFGVPRSFIDESRERSFRESAIETGVNEFESGTFGGGALARRVQEYAREGEGLMGFIAGFLIPVVRTPYNVLHRGAWWSPYGIVRLYNAGKKTKGFSAWKDANGNGLSPYEQSLADPVQLMRRVSETAIGTAAFGAMAAMLAREEGKEDDEKLFRINLSGPPRSRSAEFTAWRRTGRRPFSIQFRPTDRSEWSTVGFRRGGMEVVNFAATILGAWDQRKYSRGAVSQSDLGKYAGTLMTEMTGEAFFFLRPFTSRYSLGDKEAMGAQLGFQLSGFVPFASMLRTPNRLRDYQDYEDGFGTAFLMQMPVVPMLREDMPALNSLGDPIGSSERERSYAGAQFGIPLGYIPFRAMAKPGEVVQDDDIYKLMHAKGYFPSVKARSDFSEDISLTTYREFVRKRGGLVKDFVRENYSEMYDVAPEDFSRHVSGWSSKATSHVQREMGIGR